MRFTILTFSVVATATLLAASSYLKTESHPRLRIKSITQPQQRGQPLQVKLELAADGKTPLAVSQDQFSIHIDTDQQPFLFVADALFETNVPRVFTVMPQKPATLTMSTSTNRLGHGQRWSDLTPGKYTFRVYVNSGKTREFDYQWLGQNYSDDYKLVIR